MSDIVERLKELYEYANDYGLVPATGIDLLPVREAADEIARLRNNDQVLQQNLHKKRFDEDVISGLLAKHLGEMIDRELMHELFKPSLQDWHQVVLERQQHVSNDWLNSNITGQYKCFGHYWYFEKDSDAMLFILKWL